MEHEGQIEVVISDYILTPLSCSSLISEIVKCLIYQKCQIPYSYNWLKSAINRRRRQEKEAENEDNLSKRNINFTVENHFRTASKLYDDVEEAMKELGGELTRSIVSEVVILFGPTPICPKEVCTIRLPKLAYGHFEESHVKDALKHQHKALRQVFLSNIWMDTVDSAIPCTNTYIFIKKDDASHTKHFKPCDPLRFQMSVKQYSINLTWECSKESLCCKNLTVFCEKSQSHIRQNEVELSVLPTDKQMWYQFEYSIKGFKNVYVNKSAACDLW
ncbi:hypothetical protein HHI36_000711 [Cryptolaemus montrouzieri]|uniref:Uncharacterized protein n=1 Tax=Cryptolaemus montrouzieri TaxID=559131 RepID=A0ABD2P5R4_9CUCU